MEIKKTNIFMTRGDSESIEVSLENDLGSLVPLETGDTIYFTVKISPSSEEIFLQKIITDFPDGKALIEIKPEDTKDLNFMTYMYDLQYTKSDGQVTTIIPPSEFTITEEVTYE